LTTKLIDAYPKGIAAMTLDQGTNDDIMKLDVTFTYRYYAQTYGNQEEVGRPNSSLIQGLGDNTETSAEDVPQDLSSVIKKTGNAVFDSIGNGSSGSFG
jgi:proline dehydrogenase